MQWYESEVRELEGPRASRFKGNRPPVFYGSSSFRLWETLPEDFDARVLNFGFGGSTLQACDYFFKRLIPPVNPRSLLLYAGDNDLGDGRSVEQVIASFRSLTRQFKASCSGVPFGVLSIKPSPARFSIIDRIRRLNDLVRQDVESMPAAFYVDLFPAMLDAKGKPKPELFLEDGLHLSRDGYRLWGSLLEPYRNQIFTT